MSKLKFKLDDFYSKGFFQEYIGSAIDGKTIRCSAAAVCAQDKFDEWLKTQYKIECAKLDDGNWYASSGTKLKTHTAYVS